MASILSKKPALTSLVICALPEKAKWVPIETEPTFAHGVGEPLFALDSYRVNGGLRSYAVAPDGERFLFFKPGAQSGEEAVAETRINVVLNWFQELRERVPVD